MGRRKKSAEKDDQINDLTARLDAHIARNSHLQSRLLATIDAMDSLRLSHERELKAERRATERLSEKLDRYIDEVRAAEQERDDMKDAVEALVEKVEQSHYEFTSWPHARIKIPNVVEPISPLATAPRYDDDEGELLSYASAMITALQQERDQERLAHKRTRDQTSAKIATLQAQLARRDAELEACVVGHTGLDVNGLLAPDAHLDDQDRQLTPEETIRILEYRTAKNRTLKAEVEQLARRLEAAKRQTNPSATAAGPSRKSTNEPMPWHARTPASPSRPDSVSAPHASAGETGPVLERIALVNQRLEEEVKILARDLEIVKLKANALAGPSGRVVNDVEPVLPSNVFPALDSRFIRPQTDSDVHTFNPLATSTPYRIPHPLGSSSPPVHAAYRHGHFPVVDALATDIEQFAVQVGSFSKERGLLLGSLRKDSLYQGDHPEELHPDGADIAEGDDCEQHDAGRKSRTSPLDSPPPPGQLLEPEAIAPPSSTPPAQDPPPIPSSSEPEVAPTLGVFSPPPSEDPSSPADRASSQQPSLRHSSPDPVFDPALEASYRARERDLVQENKRLREQLKAFEEREQAKDIPDVRIISPTVTVRTGIPGGHVFAPPAPGTFFVPLPSSDKESPTLSPEPLPVPFGLTAVQPEAGTQPAADDLLDARDGEMSMELATPLMPSLVFHEESLQSPGGSAVEGRGEEEPEHSVLPASPPSPIMD